MSEPPSIMGGMTSTDITVLLDFERQHEKHTSQKEWLIMKTLRLRPARYYQLLGRIVQTREAWAADPMLCRRVLRRTSAL